MLYFKKTRKNRATTTKADGTATLEAVLVPVSAVDHLAVTAKECLHGSPVGKSFLGKRLSSRLSCFPFVYGN